MTPESHDAPRPRGGSLFFRTALFSMVVALLALIIFGLKVLNHERAMVRERLETRARLLAMAIERAMPGGSEEEWKKAATQCLEFSNAPSDVPYLVISLEGGRSFAWNSEGWRDLSLGGYWTPEQAHWNQAQERVSELSGLPVLHYNHRFEREDRKGWIHVGINSQAYETSLITWLRHMASLAVPALVVSCLASIIFSQRIVRPITALREFSERVAAGDLSARVAVGTNAEIVHLAETMNQMAARLQDSQEQAKEAQARDARLREQEILLKEIHHRVKNNLQVLSSLLRMQARQSGSEELKANMRECEGRIRSMGLIHERLYQSKSLCTIDFGKYVETLSQELMRMHGDGKKPPKVELDIKDVQLSLDTAMPCGLIINELLSNSLKYAFPDREDGKIAVRVRESDGDGFLMEVSDDGVGIEKGKPKREGSLGQRLIDMLVEQISGSIEYRNGVGLTALIRFRECKYQTRV